MPNLLSEKQLKYLKFLIVSKWCPSIGQPFDWRKGFGYYMADIFEAIYGDGQNWLYPEDLSSKQASDIINQILNHQAIDIYLEHKQVVA